MIITTASTISVKSEEVLKNNMERCKLHVTQRTRLPEADNKKERDKIKFTKKEYRLRLPIVIYSDFESVVRKQYSCKPSSSKSFTTQYQHHMLCGSWISDGQYFEPHKVNMEDDTAEKCLVQVVATATICRQRLANKIPMKPLTQEQWREYNNTITCSICTKPFKSADQKVRDHDHLTGKYRGLAHNLNYSINPKKVKTLCIIHHLKGILSML